MKILATLNFPEIGIEMLRNEGLVVTVWENELPMNREQLLRAAAEHDILWTSSGNKLDSEFLERNKHIKLISQYAAGYDNIDINVAGELGIQVANSPGAMTDATADVALALLLAVSRKLCYMHKKILRDDWGPFHPRAHLGMELKGKTLGILGMGRIGMAFAERCSGAYNMPILYHNRSKNPGAERELKAEYVSFEELLNKSDILSVHCALTEETREVMNGSAFEKMKSTAIFLNTARGGIHNEKDLINALNMGHIWGAGLDVTNPEPMNAQNPLLSMENVAVTPHIGSATDAARNEMSKLSADNILCYVKGIPIANRLV
jgi:glyoxylate reductase